ncbi:hypothetical protein MUK42_22135 [Musa troglodytarum]|uniref:Uncharacterized protein n=1 Tax=Musa troglodytarum TaxID=320322 RepID=A0A9E7GGS6_9LILI|nr:hypothetical protein MUK42_22135 [Musa troglodytarum]
MHLAAQIGLSRSIDLARRKKIRSSYPWSYGRDSLPFVPNSLPLFKSHPYLDLSWPTTVAALFVAIERADVLLLSSLATLLFNSAQITRFCSSSFRAF